MKVLSKTKSNQHRRFLDIALELSELGGVPRFKVGSVLVYHKTIISSGFNDAKTHPKQLRLNSNRTEGKQNRSFVHAELATCNKVWSVPEGSILYVARKDLGGSLAMCRPCEGCMEMIWEKGIRDIVYTTPNGFAVEHLTRGNV